MKTDKGMKLVFLAFLSLNLVSFLSTDVFAHSCTGTQVGSDTRLHDSGESGAVAYQEWHASFKGKYRCNRRGAGESRSVDYIDISDDDGNSVQVNNPGDYYTVETSDYSWLEGQDDVTVFFHANGVSSSSVTRQMPETNQPPSYSNRQPSNGYETAQDSVNLNVDISDPDSSSIDVRFYDDSGSLIGSETVSSGQTASTSWSLGPGNTYRWYVQADDGIATVTSSTWNIKTNGRPTASSPNPSDGEKIRDYTPDISAQYTDPDGDSGSLTFYDVDDNEIGSCSLDSAQRCGVEWSSAAHGSNKWYAVASDGPDSSTSPEWEFVINTAPDAVTSPVTPADGSTVYGTSTDLTVSVSDPDNDNLNVEFLNNQSNMSSSQRTVTGVSSGDTASVTLDNLDRGKEYKWWVRVSDGRDTITSSAWEFHVNSLPSISRIQPQDDGIVTDENIVVGMDIYDEESTGIGDLTTYFFRDGNVLMGSKKGTTGEFTSLLYPNTQIGQDYEWKVKVSDGYENYTSNVFEFEKTTTQTYRVTPEIEYKYSGMILDDTSSKDLFFTVENKIQTTKSLKTYLQGVNATFVENNQDTIEYDLTGGSKRRFTIYVDPASTGDKTLDIVTENQQFGVNTTASIPVTVRNYNDVSQTSEVSGIGFIQVIMLLLVSAYLYSVRL